MLHSKYFEMVNRSRHQSYSYSKIVTVAECRERKAFKFMLIPPVSGWYYGASNCIHGFIFAWTIINNLLTN